jgi:hypothetical protein
MDQPQNSPGSVRSQGYTSPGESMLRPAPIALFAYRRPRHLERVIDALRSNPEAEDTDFYIFCDGAKNASESEDVKEVRRIISRFGDRANRTVILRERNYGLAENITQGVSHVLKQSPSVIVVEDDIEVSPFFLRFMNEALAHYSSEARVGSISGYCYPVAWKGPETYFIRGADCWGWATWHDRWRFYNPDGKELLRELRDRNLLADFDLGGTEFTKMLEDQIAGKNDSWAIRWYASCFLKDLLILYPCEALAHNIGLDDSGTHCASRDEVLSISLTSRPITVGGIQIKESGSARRALRELLVTKQQTQNVHIAVQAL